MFVVVWQFEVADEKVAGFEAAYGPDGAWAQLFRSSPSYLGTELLRDAYISGAYLTIDRWASEDDFRAFRKAHDQQYEVLDRSCDALTSREARVGAYVV
jgi:heme-degrading monooxygenase HmoA